LRKPPTSPSLSSLAAATSVSTTLAMAMSSSPGALIETTCLSSRTLTLRYATPCTAGTSRS
jgi:hypothetical protein